MRHLRSAIAVLTLLTVPGLGLAPRLAAQDVDTADLYEKVVKSAVFIVTPLKGGAARGSGSLIDLDKKLVVTNYHVVDEAEYCFVQFPIYKKGQIVTNPKTYMENIPAGLAIKGKVLHRDKSRDLAFVELEKVPAGSRAIPLAKDSPRQGTTVWNIGSPGAVEQLFSITEGKVRAVGVEEHKIGGGSEAIHLKAKLVYATNPTNPGDSGGPLFNKKGEQVAVTESVLRGAQQVNLFVDITEVRAFLKQKGITIKESDDEPGKVVPKKSDLVDTAKPDPKKDNSNTAAKGPTPPAKDKEATAAPSEADEKAAADLLRRSGVFANDPDQKDYYMKRLQEIVKKYPATAAAKEAQKKLDGLK